MTRLIAPAALILLLAACSDEPAPDENARAAAGEVLEGSISDEMIAYDRLRSQPPLVEALPGEVGGDNAAAAAPEGEAPPEGEGAAEGAPTASPDEEQSSPAAD